MSWTGADLGGRDVRKTLAPKTAGYKLPRGRPPKYSGYDFDDCAQEPDDAHGPAAVQTSWAHIGDGTRQVHARNADVVRIFADWATEAWLHGEGGEVRADSSEQLVEGWLAAGNELALCPEFKRTRRYPGSLPLPWFLRKRKALA